MAQTRSIGARVSISLFREVHGVGLVPCFGASASLATAATISLRSTWIVTDWP
jgi:hypothetical protein